MNVPIKFYSTHFTTAHIEHLLKTSGIYKIEKQMSYRQGICLAWSTELSEWAQDMCKKNKQELIIAKFYHK